MVQCAWCYGKLQGWEQGDNPLKEHARHFASCPKFGDRKAVNASSLVNVHHTQGKFAIIERELASQIYIGKSQIYSGKSMCKHFSITRLSVSLIQVWYWVLTIPFVIWNQSCVSNASTCCLINSIYLYLRNCFPLLGDSSPNDLSEDDLGILTVRPCNPQFAIEASRLESYKGNWPTNLAQTPDHLSSAGFFYVGEFIGMKHK